MNTRFTYENYILAKANLMEKIFIGDEISYRISCAGYPISSQIALLMDEDEKPEEIAIYKAIRAEIKAQVKAEVAEFEARASK